MQKSHLLVTFIIVCVNCFSQQYPFVHYSPKDGLVNSRVSKAYQDSKGRMYFLTYGGLSVYDGVRFKNYTTQDGIAGSLVNDILEVGDDSLLLASNNGNYLNVMVKGKIGNLNIRSGCPVINQFYRHEDGKIYLSSDNGLFILENKNIRKLNTSLLRGNGIDLSYIGNITGTGNWLVLIANEMDPRQYFYLYDIEKNRICDSLSQPGHLVGKDEGNRIWATISDQLFIFDRLALAKGKLLLSAPPGGYEQVKSYFTNNVAFGKNCIWLVYRDKEYRNTEIRRIEENGSLLRMPLQEKAKSTIIRNMLVDKENNIWLCNDGEGVFKIVNSPLRVFENPTGKSKPEFIDNAFYFNDTTWYSTNANNLYRKSQNGLEEFTCNLPRAPEIFYNKGMKLLARDAKNIYEGELNLKKKSIYFRQAMALTHSEYWGKSQLIDLNGNIISVEETGLGVWKNYKRIFYLPVEKPDIIDNIAFDKDNLLWAITRYTGIDVFNLHPENDSKYLQRVLHFPKEKIIGSPRCFVIDKTGSIWVGTRDDGVVCYKMEGNSLIPAFRFNAGNGLTDNFVTTVACDSMNNIIVGTQTGLDRIIQYPGNSWRIENLSKNSNFFVKINQAWADSKQAYALSFSGFLLQLSSFAGEKIENSPHLLLEEMRVNARSVSSGIKKFRHKENNISFLVAAPSFIDEKQVAFSYLLEGSGNKHWSDTSFANAAINLTNLSPGNYNLKVKAFFPSASYSPAELSYSFEIAPPWWQTLLFRLITASLIMGLLIVGVRFYYRRKLIVQRRLLEKQQAIEKERTRIATDMHDDLGAGLSRIKFLSQVLSNKEFTDQSVITGLEKITGYSDEMTEKMGEIVWALNEKNDTLADLIAYTRSYAVEYLANHNIQCEANTPMHLPVTFIPGEIRRNIFLSVKECLHNIVKHANASSVYFSVELNGAIQIIIHDNGKGIDWNNRRTYGNGLENIQKRMNEIKGNVDFLNGRGTKVLLRVPLSL